MAATDEERAAYESRQAAYWGRTALYRLYGADDTLLYVGIAIDPDARWRQHEREKHWWPLVARNTVAWFEKRLEALDAEAEAIRGEKPTYNSTHSTTPAPERRHGAGGYVIEDGGVCVTVESFSMGAALANFAWAKNIAMRARWELGELPITYLTSHGTPTLAIVPAWLGEWIEANAAELLERTEAQLRASSESAD